MALVRWSPITELAGMEVDRLNRMFDELYTNPARGWVPAVDVYETEAHEVVIRAELPEVKREDIQVAFENNVLTINGQRSADEQVARHHVHRAERRQGAFSRSFTLPSTVDGSRITAAYKDG